MKHILLSFFFAIGTMLYAQNTSHIGLEAVEVTSTEKVYNFYVWDYPGIVACQFSMLYDSSKMTYKGIRNSQVSGWSASSFALPEEGKLITSWFDLLLEPIDYVDSSVLLQIVFDIVQPGGSSLCFSNTPLEYEFISYNDELEIELNEIIIHDDCNFGSLVIINPTATKDPKASTVQLIDNTHLSSTGTLAFTSMADQSITISLFDLSGKTLNTFTEREYATGWHILSCKPIIPGMYVVKALRKDGIGQVMNVFAY